MREIELKNVLSGSVDEFLHVCVRNVDFEHEQLKLRGASAIQVSAWCPATKERLQRIIRYMSPTIDDPLVRRLCGGNKQTPIKEAQLYFWNERGHLILNSTILFEGSSFGDNISIRTTITFEPSSSEVSAASAAPTVTATVHVLIDYKGMLLKGAVESHVYEDRMSYYSRWIKAAGKEVTAKRERDLHLQQVLLSSPQHHQPHHLHTDSSSPHSIGDEHSSSSDSDELQALQQFLTEEGMTTAAVATTSPHQTQQRRVHLNQDQQSRGRPHSQQRHESPINASSPVVVVTPPSGSSPPASPATLATSSPSPFGNSVGVIPVLPSSQSHRSEVKQQTPFEDHMKSSPTSSDTAEDDDLEFFDASDEAMVVESHAQPFIGAMQTDITQLRSLVVSAHMRILNLETAFAEARHWAGRRTSASTSGYSYSPIRGAGDRLDMSRNFDANRADQSSLLDESTDARFGAIEKDVSFVRNMMSEHESRIYRIEQSVLHRVERLELQVAALQQCSAVPSSNLASQYNKATLSSSVASDLFGFVLRPSVLGGITVLLLFGFWPYVSASATNLFRTWLPNPRCSLISCLPKLQSMFVHADKLSRR
eukprot:TRINITY_DN7132_c0_g1_i1.p1 TRINITY_DN7132_c0_g1~~TRINITY_DN7132_c0_g1_i1.p1  ORF type:complete len:594 (+),score=84.26 TRINITY_DN7132_c0_g1_i1:232-2013(+)